jgi:hypothetical protein
MSCNKNVTSSKQKHCHHRFKLLHSTYSIENITNGKKTNKKTNMCKATNSDPEDVISMKMDEKVSGSKMAEPSQSLSVLITLGLFCALAMMLFFSSRMEDRSSSNPKSALSKETLALFSTREIFIPDTTLLPEVHRGNSSELILELSMQSKTISTTPSTKVTTIWSEVQGHIQDLPVTKILVDFGVFVLFRAVGWPAMKALGAWLRRLSILENVSPNHLQVLAQSGIRIWKTMVLIYSRTAASKFVNRGKKLMYPFLHHDDHGDNHRPHHETQSSNEF